MIEDICAHDNDSLRAYCFCCPALRIDDYMTLYTNPPGSEALPVLSAKGKSAQDIFGKCILRKNKGPDFVRKAGPDVFHTDEELREFLTRAACGATAHIDYAHIAPSESLMWLTNMPTDEATGWNADASNATIAKEIRDAPAASGSALPPLPPAPLVAIIAEADQAVSSWKDVKRNVTVHLPEGKVARQTNPDGSLVTLPSRKADRPAREGIQLDPTAGRTEHVMILNRQVQHMGWSGPAHNQFAVLAGAAAPPALAEEPSEVDPNA
jgi:hypothetical protein